MIDRQKAIEIAREYIQEEIGPDFILEGETVREHQFVYVFYYQSKFYYQTSIFSDVFFRPGPHLIDKHDGSVTPYASGEIEGDVIISYYNEKGYTHDLVLNEEKEIEDRDERIMSQDEIDSFLNDFF